MENITIKDIVEACSGQLLCGDENKVIKEFSIDSRSGSEDSIFVPIIGERVDAHKFIDGALKINGATFTSEHDEPLEGFENKPWIKVADTVEAMQKVGTFYRNRMNLPVVAVTDSKRYQHIPRQSPPSQPGTLRHPKCLRSKRNTCKVNQGIPRIL